MLSKPRHFEKRARTIGGNDIQNHILRIAA